MKASAVITSLALASGALAACGWTLKPNDCICMNSADGSLMTDQTATCCKNMGLKTSSAKICGVDLDTRQTFKDCCKWLNQTSVMGHCH